MQHTRLGLVTSMAFAALAYGASPALAQVAPPLGVTQQFGVLGNSGVTGSTGAGTVVSGDVGSYPTPTIINFNPPSTTVPPYVVHPSADAVVQQAHTDAIAAYNALLGQGTGTVLPDNLATVGALTSGIYSFTTGAPNLPAATALTLNGGGVFIFNIGSSLTAGVGSVVVGTADPCNIYWRVGTSAVLNGTNFKGTVIADASITIGAGANLAGRALAGTGATGAVTMAGAGGNTIGGCSVPALPSCPIITLTPTTVPNARVGRAYSQTMSASGGTAPYIFTVTAGTLPTGLTLTPAGVLAGTPTAVGTFTFIIRGTDAAGCFLERPYTIIVGPAVCAPILLHPATIPNGTVGTAYSQWIYGGGGLVPYTFVVRTGTLPPGLTLTSVGLLAGTPTATGTYTFTIRGTDVVGCYADHVYTIIVVNAVPTLSQWGALFLAGLLAGLGYLRLRRRSAGAA